METMRNQGGAEWRRVQVWFGEYLISDWIGDNPQYAARLQAAQLRRFTKLRVTNELISSTER